MVIDWTAQLAPFLWVTVTLLVVSVSAIVADIDYEKTELHVIDRLLLIATAAVLAVVLVVLVATRYDVAASAIAPNSLTTALRVACDVGFAWDMALAFCTDANEELVAKLVANHLGTVDGGGSEFGVLSRIRSLYFFGRELGIDVRQI